MNICFFGQGTGGNAMLWFDFFNRHLLEYTDINQFTLLCRTKCTLPAKFHVVKPYGTGRMPKWLYRFYAPLVARIGMQLQVMVMARKTKYDVLHIQGNYDPGLNLQVMNLLKCKTVLNIYGSDFYRQYLLGKFSVKDRVRFEEVVRRSDHIVCNWISTKNDFIKAFPETTNRCSFHTWGYDEKWQKPASPLTGWPLAEKVFLSARGVYDYNNIDVVVESFCRAYRNRLGYKLYIVNGYGNHPHAIKRVNEIIERYNAQEQVVMRIGQWISDDELQALYERADYNICFGSSDQLTVSICYACEKKAINILSPLGSYKDLQRLGYRSLQLVDGISVDALTSHLESIAPVNSELLEADKVRIRQDFNMTNTFNSYVEIYKKITA